MRVFTVPTRAQVSAPNQNYFDYLHDRLGMMPNLYAALAYSKNALGSYLQLQNRKTVLKAKEKAAIALVVSQINKCTYSLSAHTMAGRLNGYTDEEMLEIRQGAACFEPTLHALVQLTSSVVVNRGQPDEPVIDNFFMAGYKNEHLVDTILTIGDVMIGNFLNRVMRVPVDFPEAPAL